MGTIWLKQFGGVDARRLPETTPSDSLIRGTDGHITRGGEFEKRAAFVPTYTLPANKTFGLAADSSSVYVFYGDNVGTPSLPAGVTGQLLASTFGTILRAVSWDLFEDKIYVVGGTNGVDLAHFYDGAVAVGRAGANANVHFVIESGSPGSTADVFVAGVSVTGGPVAWAGSINATAAAIAAAINSTSTSPDYTGSSAFFAFIVTAADIGTAANGRIASIVTTGTITIDAASGNVLTGGVDGYLSGTRYVRTINLKMYTLSQTDLQFSSLENPLDWDGSLGGTGFGFIDTSMYTAGSEDLTAVVEFRGQAAVFSQRTIQLWTVASDPASNVLGQRLRNTGTSCPRSLTQFGDFDMFYLDENGLRSLRASTGLVGFSTSASTYAAGSRVDPLIVAKLRSLTETQRASVIGLIDPATGNFWLIMRDTIFVYASFPDEGASGWTVYKPGFNISDAVVFKRRVYVRSGNTIYVYGGLATGLATDSTEAEAWTAYLDDGDPAAKKTWTSFDAAVIGEWEMSAGMSLRDTDAADSVAVISRTTYNDERIGAVGQSTHISLRFKSRGDGPAVLGACVLRYE